MMQQSVWILAGTLVLALAAPLAAQEAQTLPALTALTMELSTGHAGFLNGPEDTLTTRARMNFFLKVPDLKRWYDEIQTIQLVTDTQDTWTIKKETYHDFDKNTLGGWGRWYFGGSPGAFGTLLPVTLTARVTLTDNRVVSRRFTINLPDPVPPGSLAPRLLVSEGFSGLMTPYHRLLLKAPSVTQVHLVGTDLVVVFAVDEPRIKDVGVLIYSEDGNQAAESGALVGGGKPTTWLNDGEGLFVDGRPNTVRIPLSQLKFSTQKPLDNLCVWGWDAVPPESNAEGLNYFYDAYSPRYTFTPEGTPAVLKVEAYRKAVEAAQHPQPSPRFFDSQQDLRSWELRLEGVLAVLNRHGFDQLRPTANTKVNRDQEAAGLEASWGVVDRTTMLDTLKTLEAKGHRGRFTKMAQLVLANPGVSDAGLAALADRNDNIRAEDFPFVRAFIPVVHGRSLTAWDLGRMVYLARVGFLLGYLTEDEAWTWIDRAGSEIRETYDSWADFGENYVIGRLFWGGEARVEALYLEAHGALVTLLGKGGAWFGAPWPPRIEAGTDFHPTAAEVLP